MLGIGLLMGFIGAAMAAAIGLLGGLLGLGWGLLRGVFGLVFHPFRLLLLVAGILWIVAGRNRGNVPAAKTYRDDATQLPRGSH